MLVYNKQHLYILQQSSSSNDTSSKVQAFKQNGKQQNSSSSIRGCRVTYRAASVIRSSMSPDVHLERIERRKNKE